ETLHVIIVEIKDILLEIVKQEKKKIEEAPTAINFPDMIIGTLPILITDILPKIIILPIALTLEIETDLEIGIIITSIIIIDLEKLISTPYPRNVYTANTTNDYTYEEFETFLANDSIKTALASYMTEESSIINQKQKSYTTP
ncbi:5358_t:CDS:2, partial [Cetraspora pellucida]